MCCRFRVDCPPPEGYEALLLLADFKPPGVTGTNYWRREFPPVQGIVRSLTVLVYKHHIEFNLAPSIGSHSPWEHGVGSFPAAVAVKLMAILAEKAGGGVIKQTSMMGDCVIRSGGHTSWIIGEPPTRPVLLENMCPGFQDFLTKGIPIEIIDGQTQRMSEDYIGERPAPIYYDIPDDHIPEFM